MKQAAFLAAFVGVTFIGSTVFIQNNILLKILWHLMVSGVAIHWLWTLIRKRRPIPRTPLDIPLAAYGLVLVWSTLNSDRPRFSFETLWLMGMHLLWFYMLVDMMRLGKQRALMESASLLAGILIIVTTIEAVSWYFGLGFVGDSPGWFTIGGFRDPIPPIRYKLAVALNVSTILGNFVLLILPIIMVWSATVARADNRWGLRLVAGGLLLVLWGTGSRGAQLGFLGASGVLVAFGMMRWPPTRPFAKPVWIFPAIAAGLIALSAAGVWQASQADRRGDSRRVDIWQAGLQMAQDEPLTGVGIRQFGVTYHDLRDHRIANESMSTAHNLVINTLAEVGVGGGLVMVAVAFSFVQMWFRAWRTTYTGRQIRLEGILAALAGFLIHSTVDAFTYSAAALVIGLATAYVIAGDVTLRTKQAPPAPTRFDMVFRPAMIFVIGAALVWWLRADVAEFRYLSSIGALGEDDYQQALDHIDRAQALDPALALYDFQEAYILGRMAANGDPDALQAAISAHEALQDAMPTSDAMRANLAILYMQAGRYDDAISQLLVASTLQPDVWQYDFLLAQVYAANAQPDDARRSYIHALRREPNLSHSDFWQNDDAIVQDAIRIAPDGIDEARRMDYALNLGQPSLIETTLASLPDGVEGAEGRGDYAASTGDFEAAITEYSVALAATSSEQTLARLHAKRSEAYLAFGEDDNARQAAQTAIFINPSAGHRAHYVLAQLELADKMGDLDLAQTYLGRAVTPSGLEFGYGLAVFGRPMLQVLLPQGNLPGTNDYTPWFELAEFYAMDTDEETDPADVYQAILDDDAYNQRAAEALGTIEAAD